MRLGKEEMQKTLRGLSSPTSSITLIRLVWSILSTVVLAGSLLVLNASRSLVRSIRESIDYFIMTLTGDEGKRFKVGGHDHSLIYDYSHEPVSQRRKGSNPSLRGVPRSRRFPTLILDLDETLVHTSDTFVPGADLRVELVQRKRTRIFYVVKRPFLDVFLSVMSRYYELVIFTASIRRYADPVIDLIDPKGLVSKRLFRESCTSSSLPSSGGAYHFVKDLCKVSSDLARTLIVDNSPEAFSMFKENGVHIKPWFDDPKDEELVRLIPFLISLKHVKDVRSVLKRSFYASGGT